MTLNAFSLWDPALGRQEIPYQEGDYTPLVSPSQIVLANTCLRKWHGAYVQGMREPDTEATKRGTAIHEILEEHLATGKPIDVSTLYGQIAASGYKYHPAPGSGLTEPSFRLSGPLRADGTPVFVYYGLIDWIHKSERKVKDHKTTSDFKYQKTEDTLRTDPQGVIYGCYALVTKPPTDGDESVELGWIYYLTAAKSRRQARETRFRMSPGELTAAKGVLDDQILELLPNRRLPFHELPGTPRSCFMYGKPCHLKHLCSDIKPSIGDLMSASKDALLANLKAKGLGAVAPPGVPLPPPLPGVAVPAGPPGLPSLPTLPGQAAAPPPPAALLPGGLPTLPPLPGSTRVAAPPVAIPSLPTIAAGVAPPALPTVTAGPPALPALTAPPVIDPAILAAAAAEGAKAPKAPKAPAVQAANVAAVNATLGKPIGVLYVDCLPVGEPVTPFAGIAEHCHQGIRETMGLAHYRFAEFGKGPGIWCEAVKMYASAVRVDSLYLDTSAGDARDALEALLGLAESVVRGVR